MQPRKNLFKFLNILAIVVWFTWSVVVMLYGEKVPVGDGFGWDGAVYGEAARDLPGMIEK
jgi:hypothetical protein